MSWLPLPALNMGRDINVAASDENCPSLASRRRLKFISFFVLCRLLPTTWAGKPTELQCRSPLYVATSFYYCYFFVRRLGKSNYFQE